MCKILNEISTQKEIPVKIFLLEILFPVRPTGFWPLETRWFPTGNPTGETQRELLLLKSTGITPDLLKSTGITPVEISW